MPDGQPGFICRNRETVNLWFPLQDFPDDWTHGASVAAGRF